MMNRTDIPVLRAILLMTAVNIGACSKAVDHQPLARSQFEQTTFRDTYPHRFWGDQGLEDIERLAQARVPQLRQLYPDAAKSLSVEAPLSRLLAISGGGADGAFGAGLLAGWTESGKRVEFEVVTGVSTGAIIAPFAFLGPDYDETIVDIYANGSSDKVFELALFGGLLLGSAATDTTPLASQIERYITPDLIEEIASENERGRSLFIVTTHFDARRPVVWDIGAIAEARDANALKLIRQIIRASAAIPALFPPVPIEFESNGQMFTELHVDGGLSHNVFAYPAQIPVARLNEILGLTFRREIYVIQNSNVRFPYAPAPTTVVPISQKAISTLLQNQVNADVERIYFLAERDDVDFRIAAIPEDFEADGATDFDPEYMNALIDVGRSLGRQGDFWLDRPSTLEPNG